MTFTPRDEYAMKQAILQAQRAEREGEVPVGAVLMLDDEIIAQGFNCPISTCDPSAHAEIVTLRNAASVMNNYRLLNTTLYVTLEPCIMCVGAMIHARIAKLIYGAVDNKAGAVSSKLQTLDQTFLNHRVNYAGGLLAEECGDLLTQFFRRKR